MQGNGVNENVTFVRNVEIHVLPEYGKDWWLLKQVRGKKIKMCM